MLRLGWIKPKEPRQVYLDYAAATPLRPEIAAKMSKVAGEVYANPSAIHRAGLAARERVEASRLALARCLKVRPEGVIFTGSGTESNNLALHGLIQHLHTTGRSYDSMTIISTRLEHPSVGVVLEHLASLGVQIRYVSVTADGLVDMTQFETLLDPSVVLVTVSYVNSEIGVIQDVARIARFVKKFNTTQHTNVFVHIDAAQAPLWLPCQFDGLGVDMMSLDAGKCYGPKGVGVLAIRHGVTLAPIIQGGGQEYGLRAATENTAGIVGASLALVEAQEHWESRSAAVAALRDSLIAKLEAIDGVVLNGAREKRVANNVNISIENIDGEFAVVSLDEAGFAVSTKSACSGASGGGSAVVQEISGDAGRAHSTIRITLGEETTAFELDLLVQRLRAHITTTRSAHSTLTQT